ncbi:Riboflavin synthase-like beta-barrel [Phytophthora cactorum]|nr:Riboflavin synthase-like beta-barrel [Phytophthora cactorum]
MHYFLLLDYRCEYWKFRLFSLHGLAYISTRNNLNIEDNPKVMSGMAAFIAMVVLYLLSLEWIHRRFHEFFVRTHWVLFIVILVAAVIHGGVFALVGILPWEIDLVYRLAYRSRIYSNGTLCGRKPRSLAYDLNTRTPTKTSKKYGVAARDQLEIFQLAHDITCIRFPRVRLDTGEEFKYKAGQYAFLCVPTLSSLEWHPFSFSSSPHEDYATFHIKAVGDWTMKLLQAAPEDRNEGKAPFEGLIDGPYGNLSIDIEDSATYSHFVFFAEDMGVTSVYRELATQDPYLPDMLLCPTTLNVSAETFFTEIYVARGLIVRSSPFTLLVTTDGIRGRLPSRVRGGAQPQLVRARAQGESTQRVFYGDPAPEPETRAVWERC